MPEASQSNLSGKPGAKKHPAPCILHRPARLGQPNLFFSTTSRPFQRSVTLRPPRPPIPAFFTSTSPPPPPQPRFWKKKLYPKSRLWRWRNYTRSRSGGKEEVEEDKDAGMQRERSSARLRQLRISSFTSPTKHTPTPKPASALTGPKEQEQEVQELELEVQEQEVQEQEVQELELELEGDNKGQDEGQGESREIKAPASIARAARTARVGRDSAAETTKRDTAEHTKRNTAEETREMKEREDREENIAETAADPHQKPQTQAQAQAQAQARKRVRSEPVAFASQSASPSAKKARPSPTTKPAPATKAARSDKYAHLPLLEDVLAPELLVLFVGLNPGIATAQRGHAYAHPSNWFWRLLHTSGLTPERKLDPSEDGDLPRLYSYGNTNIVARPTRDGGELTRSEMSAGTPLLEAKVRAWRPEAVCLVGKGIWEAVWRSRYGREMRKPDFRYGWQSRRENMGLLRPGAGPLPDVPGPPVPFGPDDPAHPWPGARLFVATTTSGLAASLSPAQKTEIWRPLGDWARRRRREREQGTTGAEVHDYNDFNNDYDGNDRQGPASAPASASRDGRILKYFST